MKLKVLSTIALITLTLTLAGCQPLTDFKEGVKDGVEQVEKTPKLSKEEYVQNIGELKREFEEGFKQLGLVTNDLENENFVEDSLAQLNKVRAIVDKYKALNPPDEFKEVQAEYLKSMDLFVEGMDAYAKGIKEADQASMTKGIEVMTKAQDHWNYAFALLDVTENIPVGTDGTLFSDDLADLDKNTGIDRNSVITNLSKDGKELVGKWGYENEDGSFNVSLVLESDGSYSGYGKGAYPETDMKGTWKYDYVKRVVTFEHDNSEFRNLRMDVQSFQKGEVQLMDLDSLNTFQYKKEGSSANDKSTDSNSSTPKDSSTDSTSSKEKPSSPSSSPAVVTEEQLNGSEWNLDSEGWDYKGLFLNEDGTATYNSNIDEKDEVYRGIWSLEGNNIVIKVKSAEENYGDEMANFPKELIFEVVAYDSKSMKVKFNGKLETYKIYE